MPRPRSPHKRAACNRRPGMWQQHDWAYGHGRAAASEDTGDHAKPRIYRRDGVHRVLNLTSAHWCCVAALRRPETLCSGKAHHTTSALAFAYTCSVRCDATRDAGQRYCGPTCGPTALRSTVCVGVSPPYTARALRVALCHRPVCHRQGCNLLHPRLVVRQRPVKIEARGLELEELVLCGAQQLGLPAAPSAMHGMRMNALV